MALALGPFKIHWYGLMYLLGFAVGWRLGLLRAKTKSGWSRDRVGDLLFYALCGVVFGGRIGYMLFYDLPGFLARPWRLVMVWQGGDVVSRRIDRSHSGHGFVCA